MSSQPAKPTRVEVLIGPYGNKFEARSEPRKDGGVLCLQCVRYVRPDGEHYGYRFMWWSPDRGYHPDRGQARLPSLEEARKLMAVADQEGWGGYVSTEVSGWKFARAG